MKFLLDDGNKYIRGDVSKIRNLGWAPEIDLRKGIVLAYADYLKRNG